MNNISSGYLSPFLNPRRSDEGESKDEVRASFQGRKISDALPASNKLQCSRAALVDYPVDNLDSRAITKRGFDAVTTAITITDSGQTLGLESAWEEIDYSLRNLIGLSPAHMAKAKQCLNTLPVSEFRYFEDLTDAVITRLNAAEGTEYPLTGALETGGHPVSGKTGGTLWTLCKYIITALAAESVLTHLSRPAAGARPDHLRHTFQFIGNSNPGFPNRMTLPLPDACSDHHAVDMVTLKPGKTICMKKGSVHGHTSRHFLLNHSRAKKSITLSTGHGSGDLRLFANHTRWPDITRPPLSNARGNAECATIRKNPDTDWTLITVSGDHEKASLVADFDTDKCRVPRNADSSPRRNAPIRLLRDACSRHPHKKNGSRLLIGRTVCLPDGNQTSYYFVRGNEHLKNLAITTGHGSGNLDLHVSNHGWDDAMKKPPESAQPGNNECVIFNREGQPTTFIAIKGDRKDASLAIDFNAEQCRTAVRKGFYKTYNRMQGYPYKSAHLLIYKVNFRDTRINWPNLEDDLNAMQNYFASQSFGNFKVSWEMVEVNLHETVNNYSRGSVVGHRYSHRFAFKARCRELARETGINPWYPDADNIVTFIAPSFSDHDSYGGESFLTVFDHHNKMGVIAHELGHAMGLRHAKSIEGGDEIIKDQPDNDSWYHCQRQLPCIQARNAYLIEYGNPFSLMGKGAITETPGEMNLLYKSFFGWLDLDTDVPMITTSGKYRIHAFDHGDKSNGPVGLRLKSGNGDYTYWIEYRTTGRESDNTKQGVLINLEGYAEGRKHRKLWNKTAYLLDMTPASANSSAPNPLTDFKDAALTAGNNFTDHWGGFTITPTQTGGTENTSSAWIEVDVVKTDPGPKSRQQHPT